jgi:WD40 repeat protein
MDVEGGIARGDDFPEQLEQAINAAAAVVVVIGRQWLTCTDLRGKRRLEKPDDWVRNEINVAIKRGTLLLPVLVDGASMPSPDELPDDLHPLTRRQASEISDTRWDYDVGEVIKVLERVIPVRPHRWSLSWTVISAIALASLMSVWIWHNAIQGYFKGSATRASETSQSAAALSIIPSPKNLPDRLIAEGNINSIAFSPDGRVMAYSSAGNIMLWDMANGRPIRTLQLDLDPYTSGGICLTFSPDGVWLVASGHFPDIKVFQTDSWQLNKTLSGHQDWVRAIVFSQDGHFLASGADDKTVKLWEFPSGKLVKTFVGHAGFVLSVSFSADGQRIASGGMDNVIKIWNTSSEPSLIRTISAGTPNGVDTVAFSPDGQLFAWTSDNGVINVWDAETLQPLKVVNHPAGDFIRPGSPRALVFSRDSRQLVSAFLFSVALWDVASGRLLDTDMRHPDFVYAISVSPDNAVVASGGQDKTLLFWRIR